MIKNIPQALADASGDPPSNAAPLPCGLYIHIPWCVKKCPYCDFNSHAVRGSVPETEYTHALIDDLTVELDHARITALTSIYFGGGTPSIMAPGCIEKILDAVAACVDVNGVEITLEANPGTVDAARFSGFRQAGVNRLSIGVQSFHDPHLETLGRIHNGNDAANAARAAKQAGFERINLDLMFALPGQTLAAALDDLDRAMDLAAGHLSCYQLTIEPNTAFAQSPPPLPDPDFASDMQDAIISRLADHGFERYEVSAYARPGERCRHNVNYWSFGDYIGIGAGAHGKLTLGDAVTRRAKVRHPRRYLSAQNHAQRVQREHRVPPSERAFEFMLNALRLKNGFTPASFCERTGLPISRIKPILNEAVERNLLTAGGERIHASARGYGMLDDLVAMFLPNEH